ncbi:MAG: NBR1-Ig-like domain-containing protein [Chloroflexota bacterium]
MRLKPNLRFFLIVLVLISISLACGIDIDTGNNGTNPPEQASPTDTSQPPADPGQPDQPQTPTDTSPPPATVPPVPPTDTPCEPDSEFVADLNIPDGTLIAPGATFTKSWRIENDGTCTWDSTYTWEQIDSSGNKLLASVLVMPIASTVAPGGTLEITVTLTLSATATVGERYDAFFQMRSPGGDLFGTHPYARIYAAPHAGVCPVGPSGQSLFINTSEKFCFLYPTGYNAYIGATGSSHVNEPPATQGEQILPSVSITNYGSSGGLGTNAWAASMISSWEAPASPAVVTNTEVGGIHAKSAAGLPGIVTVTSVFLVHDGDGWVFTIQPVYSGMPVRTTTALELWEIVRLSFTFYGP